MAYNHGASKLREFGCCFELKEDEARIPYVYHSFSIDEEYAPYIALLLNNPKIDRQLKRLVSSSVRMDGLLNISYDEYMTISLSIPELTEQKKMCSFLTILDARIVKQKELIDLLKSYKRGLIRTLLSPDSSRRSNVKWTSVQIGELGNFTKGAPLSKADITTTGTPFILYGELYTTYGEVITSIVRKTEANVDSIFYSKIGDVIIPTSGETPEEISTASCVMVPGVILAGDLNIFRTTKIDGRILSYILNHIANWQIARIAQGKSVVHIQASELEQIEIVIPDYDEQLRIASVLEKLDKAVSGHEITLRQLTKAKKALLQQLFV